MVLQKLDAGLLTITMNRPDRRNALNPDMTRGLVEAARRAAEDHEVRAVLLKGAGGTFCVGGDVKSMAEGRAPLPFEAKMANLRRGMEVSRILHQMPKPVVAQVDGAAAGAGLSIALSCDLRVASASCKITTAFAKVGLSGDYGGTYFLTQMLGSAKARELYLTSPVLSATGGLQSRHGDQGGAGRRGRSRGARSRDVAGAGAVGDAGLHQAQHQQRRDDVAGSLLRRRSDPSLAFGRDRRSQGSGESLRREAQARCFRAIEMAGYLRLRQICLVAPHLEPVISDIAAIMGLNVCYRDGNVAKYGLENALLPVDTILLEVVAPTQPGTAAGRFLDKTGGRGGYMAIFCCDDPDARGRHANGIGVRTANVITHAPYHGVQLHPRDCRAAFIEFNHTEGSDDVLGPYPPAGPDWQKSIRKDVTQALTEVEMQSPDPQGAGRALGKDHRHRRQQDCKRRARAETAQCAASASSRARAI